MRIIGVALLVFGLGLAYWGYEASGSLSAQFNETVMGQRTDKVMWLYIGGATSLVVGLLLILRK